MPVERLDSSAISLFVGAEPREILTEFKKATEDVLANFSRWDGATFDSEGFVLVGRVRVDGGTTIPLFVVVKYHDSRGGWSTYHRDQLAVHLANLGLGAYLERQGHNRFMASVAVSD